VFASIATGEAGSPHNAALVNPPAFIGR